MSGKPLNEADTKSYSPANDYEGEMAITQLKAMIEKAQAVLSMLKPEAKLEAWVQSKITLADDYMSSVSDYLKHTDGAIGESVQIDEEMKDYIAMYNGKKIVVKADSSYKAQLKAIEMLKPPSSKRHMVHVHLANDKAAFANNEEVKVTEAFNPADHGFRIDKDGDKFILYKLSMNQGSIRFADGRKGTVINTYNSKEEAIAGAKRNAGVKEEVERIAEVMSPQEKAKQDAIDARIRKLNTDNAVDQIKEILRSYTHDKKQREMIIAAIKQIKEEVEITEAPMIAPPDTTLRGYSPTQFENKFRELLSRLGFSKALPIKKFGTSFWVSFENMPKARDFSMTLENLMRRNMKPGVKLTKVLSLEAGDEAIAKGIVPSSTRAVVVVNLGNVMQEAFESYGFVAEDFYKNAKEEV